MRGSLLVCAGLLGIGCAANPAPPPAEPPVLPVVPHRPPAPLLLVHREAMTRIEADLRALGDEGGQGAVGRLLARTGLRAFGAPMDNEEGATFAQTFELEAGPRARLASNVVGIVKANRYSPTRGEHVVVALRSARVDPAGMQPARPGEAGEDPVDAAILVEAARRVVETSLKPRRNIVFAAFGADGQGAAGLRRWLASPLGPVKIDALIQIGPAGRGPRAVFYSRGEGLEKAARAAAADLAFDPSFIAGAEPPFDEARFPVAVLRRPESAEADGDPGEVARQSTFVARLALALSERCGAIGDPDAPCPRVRPEDRPGGKHAPWPVEWGPPTWRWEKGE